MQSPLAPSMVDHCMISGSLQEILHASHVAEPLTSSRIESCVQGIHSDRIQNEAVIIPASVVKQEKFLHAAGGECLQEVSVKPLEHRTETIMLNGILRMRAASKTADADLLKSTESAPTVE